MNIMDSLGNESYEAFYVYYMKAYDEFQNYGELVFKKRFGDGDDELKEMLKNSESQEEFSSKLRNFWAKKYQFVITKFSEIEKGFKMATGDMIYVPNVGDGLSPRPKVFVSEEFWNKVKEKSNRAFGRDNYTYIKYIDNIFVIEANLFGGFHGIKLIEKVPLTIIVDSEEL